MPTEQSKQEEVSLPQKLVTDAFDEVAKGLAAGTISRCRALKLTGSALLGGGLLAMFPGVAGAQSIVPDDEVSAARRVTKGCEHGAAINNKTCPGHKCGRRRGCFCATTVGGDKKCVNLRNAQCPEQDECDSNMDCPRGSVCLKVGGCCGHPARNDCRPLCG
jgi:hypothetical protein